MTTKTRAYCFTLNNYTPDEVRIAQEMECQFIVFGYEQGEAKHTPHLQGYVYFAAPRYAGGLKHILARAHWEPARSDAKTNQEYCSKSGNFYQRGTMPANGKRKGEVMKEQWEAAFKAAKRGDLDEVDYSIRFRYYGTIKQIAKDFMDKPADLPALDNLWIWGPPGVGKSRSARILYPEAYMKMANKWWDGYQGQTNVILDDLGIVHDKLGHHIKIWADHYAFIGENKGGALFIRPKRIIITSNYSIEHIFRGDDSMIGAINRRFKVQFVGTDMDFTVPEAQNMPLEDIAVPVDAPQAEAAVPFEEEPMEDDFDPAFWDTLEQIEV